MKYKDDWDRVYKMVLITNDNMYRMESHNRPDFEDMGKLVGGYVTQTMGTFEGKEVWILVDEDGLDKDLPTNHMASACSHQMLVGDALILVNFELE